MLARGEDGLADKLLRCAAADGVELKLDKDRPARGDVVVVVSVLTRAGPELFSSTSSVSADAGRTNAEIFRRASNVWVQLLNSAGDKPCGRGCNGMSSNAEVGMVMASKVAALL